MMVFNITQMGYDDNYEDYGQYGETDTSYEEGGLGSKGSDNSKGENICSIKGSVFLYFMFFLVYLNNFNIC